MRRLVARALGALTLGALLVGGVVSGVDTAASAATPARTAHAHVQPMDWWT